MNDHQRRQDDDLSPDARSYVLSLRSRDQRDAARDYASMDEQLFRARVGPAIDDLLVEVRRLSRPMSKRQVAGWGVLGAATIEAIVRAITAWRGGQ